MFLCLSVCGGGRGDGVEEYTVFMLSVFYAVVTLWGYLISTAYLYFPFTHCLNRPKQTV